jgi:hypothetical protein
MLNHVSIEIMVYRWAALLAVSYVGLVDVPLDSIERIAQVQLLPGYRPFHQVHSAMHPTVPSEWLLVVKHLRKYRCLEAQLHLIPGGRWICDNQASKHVPIHKRKPQVRHVHVACRSTGLTIVIRKARERPTAEHFLL